MYVQVPHVLPRPVPANHCAAVGMLDSQAGTRPHMQVLLVSCRRPPLLILRLRGVDAGCLNFSGAGTWSWPSSQSRFSIANVTAPQPARPWGKGLALTRFLLPVAALHTPPLLPALNSPKHPVSSLEALTSQEAGTSHTDCLVCLPAASFLLDLILPRLA